MGFIRKILYKILGLRRFIRLISKIYIVLVKNGFLKSKYPELFFLESIIKKGDTCIDIGANVGYYSTFMSKHAGTEGKVYAVEPIPMFADIWRKNVRMSKIKNLTMFPYALGGEEKIVQMGIPERDGVLHHGMTKITSTGEENYIKYFDVEMKVPNKLFSEINKIDFIKCDVEGYESYVFDNMIDILNQHKPVIQTELGGKENREHVYDLLTGMGYDARILKHGELTSLPKEDIFKYEQDFYFVPANKA